MNNRFTLFVLLLSGFMDYAGIAIVYPIFAYILFDPSSHFLPPEASSIVRGMWLGVLLALYPLFQFFFAPILGAISDLKGRRRLMVLTIALSVLGYAIAILGMYYESLFLLVLYRILVGVAGGNCSVVSAIIADVSTPEKKTKNYGLLNMSFGAGFTIGPFISGYLADKMSVLSPFYLALALVILNLILVYWKLQETYFVKKEGKVSLFFSITQLKLAFQNGPLRSLFVTLLFFSLGWSFFTEFVALFLIERYEFTPHKVGLYYGYTGFFYALSAGFLIFPIIKKWGLERILFLSMLLSGLYLFLFLQIDNPSFLWLYLPLTQFFFAFAYPSIATVISNQVSNEKQGEVLGIYQAVIAFALAVTPFFCGAIAGRFPFLSILVGGIFMAIAAIVYAIFSYLPSKSK